MANDFESIHASLTKKRKELNELQRELEALQRAELMSLPRRVGVESVDELIRLLLPLASPNIRFSASNSVTNESGRRVRAVVTPDVRKRALELLATGNLTAANVARQVGVSTSFVNKLKAAEGLTRRSAGSKR